MTFFILTLFQSGYKIRTSTLYHLLVGKRTSSVLLHGFFYHNLIYLGALPNLQDADFQRELKKLVAADWIIIDEGFGMLTSRGKKQLAERKYDLSGLDNLRYGRTRENSWQLLLFAVQVISHLSYGKKEYIPIENRPFYLQQIKKWLVGSGPNLVKHFQQELLTIFQQLPSKEADFLANQFSGYDFQGKTAFQLLPEKYQNAPWNQLFRQHAIDLFLAQVKKGELARLLSALDQQNLNKSMLKTREYFLAGKTEAEILRLRHLKQGTINDHFIEWALLEKAFPFERFELLEFNQLSSEEVLDQRYQEYDIPYLNFRLSQIYYLREKQWT
ncbi:helix-turn-helix domain-containing protein [Enterococcus sp. DIV0187]|uniref:helix-turn-helix domain-containing protein n=1 Tax=Enterococcus sp. DIV0187 TaxID=2774644 RepID=UPI003F2458C0